MQWYFLALAAVVVAAAVAGAVLVRARSNEDARHAAQSDARSAASSAAIDTAQTMAEMRTTVVNLAGSPGPVENLRHPSGCSLSFSLGSLGGYLVILRSDGTLLCSSQRRVSSRSRVAYRHASWLDDVRRGTTLVAPTPDPSTGAPSAVVARRFPGGVVAAFVRLAPLAPVLAASYDDGHPIEFVIADRRTILSRSLQPDRWAGVPFSATTFRPAWGGATGRDVQGRTRLYEAARVVGTPWTVFAGYDRKDALAAAMGLQRAQMIAILAGLLATLLVALLIYRAVARPIQRLGRAVSSAAERSRHAEVSVTGPRQVRELGRDVNELIHSVNRELLERERAEQTAAASEHNFRMLFDGIPTPTWVYAADSLAVLEVNRAALEHYGYSREEFLFLTMADIEAGGAAYAAESGNGAASPTEGAIVRHRKRSGAEIEIAVRAYPVRFGDRDAFAVIAEDVGERERLARQLRQSQRLESLGQLAGGVAHDFNNLLAVIVAYAGLLKGTVGDGEAPTEELRDDLDQIELAAQRGVQLTRQLLIFSRREITQVSVIDVREVVLALVPLLKQAMGEHIRLDTPLGDDLWPIAMDPGQLEQVLVNLAVNARDAMPTGGRLTIDAGNVDVDELYGVTHPGLPIGRYLRLRVSDTGCGIDPDTLQHVFEPFFTTKAKGEGTGLGLSTVYGIITQASGRVHIYSEVGHGTTFNVLLPAVDGPAPPAAASPATEPAVTAAGETVLVVEDEEALRTVTARMLARHGYRVLTAADGREAIAIATQESSLDLLLTDVVMPELLGREVAAQIGEIRDGVRVLYVSGYARPVLGAQGTLDPGDALLEKPFSEAALLAKVREVLDASARGRRPRWARSI